MSAARPTADVTALAAWMDRRGLAGRGTRPDVSFISGGSQNEIFEVRRGDARMVLRAPPADAVPGRDDGIRREWRLISALAGSDVPHTRAIAMCDDPSVLGRPFYLMDFVDGWSPMGHDDGLAEPYRSDVSARAGLARELVGGAARLARVDWRAVGLADFGRPDGFHERQVDRWLAFWERADGRADVEGLHVAAEWLRARRPIDFVPGIMHGDYQFANVMFDHASPARLAAIVDWEMTTIGDPKLDLAWALRDWPASGPPQSAGYISLVGMPERDELVAEYASISGRQVDDFDYYLVLARWKLGIVLEQGFRNAGDDPVLVSFGDEVRRLMAAAAELAESSDYRVTAS